MEIEDRVRLDYLKGLRLIKSQILAAIARADLTDISSPDICQKKVAHYHTYEFNPDTRRSSVIVVGTIDQDSATTEFYYNPIALFLGHPCGTTVIVSKDHGVIRRQTYFAPNVKRFEIISL